MRFYTGDITCDLWFENTLDEKIPYRDQVILWSGCIDAPEALPAGSHVSVSDEGSFGVAGLSVYRPDFK